MRGIKAHGESILRFRKARGWTQEQLARRCGCDVRTVHNAERSRAVVFETLRLLAVALETTPGALSNLQPATTSQLQRNRDFVVTWHDLYLQQDVGRFMELHHRDTVARFPGSEGMSAGGTYRGINRLRQQVETALDTVPVVKVHEMRIDAIGDLVFARPTVTMYSTKKRLEFNITHVNEFQVYEGKVVRRVTYADYSKYRRHLLPEDSGVESTR